jgi:hypothetical protein
VVTKLRYDVVVLALTPGEQQLLARVLRRHRGPGHEQATAAAVLEMLAHPLRPGDLEALR